MTNDAELPPSQPDPTDLSVPQGLPELDRGLLNDLTRRASVPQTYYGRDLTLTEADREQLRRVAELAEEKLASADEDPRWDAFRALMQEGAVKGVLISFVTHPGTNVPTWCVDGGEDALVKKVRSDAGRAAIEVPSFVYNTFHWKLTCEALQRDATASDELLNGRSASDLGKNLRQVAHLLGDTE